MPKNRESKRESLADWVRRGLETHAPIAQEVPRRAPPADTATRLGQPRYVPLQVWADRLLGEHAPHQNTLLRWVHEGLIQPKPIKIGRRWYVQPNAEYVP